MKDQHTPQTLSNIVGLLHDVIARVGMLTLPRGLAPIPIPVRRPSGPTRWVSSRRRPGWLPLLVGVVLLAACSAWAGVPALPAGVPDISDPAVQAHFQPVGVASLRDNPDWPVILLANTTGEQPPALLLGFDARHGKDTWSLMEDPLILIVVLADEATIQGVYLDTGFRAGGRASGTYAAVDAANASALPDLLKTVTAGAGRPE